MTAQEQQMLQDLTSRVNQTSLQDKDAEAEQYLQQTLGRNPDALYILAQTVLVQQYALDQAKKQLDEARAQSQQLAPPAPQKHTSFLGNLLGSRDDQQQAQQVAYTPVGNPAPPPPAPYGNAFPGQFQSAPQYAQPGYGQAPQGGFLRNAMQTAAGVAAGAFAFQGIENLMSGFGHHAGYGGGSGLGDLSGTGREEIVNNYYGDTGKRGAHESRDIEDRRDDSFGDRLEAADTDSGNDDNYGSDSSDEDTGADDSSYDPGGNDDSF